jgi:hypothetical protein
MPFNLDEHKNELSQTELECISNIHEEQCKLNMIPRNDSLLTYNFAKKNAPTYITDEKAVAHELFVVDQIYQNTNYANIIEDTMREIAAFIHFKYNLDWTKTWEIVRFYVPDILKMFCAEKYNLSFNFS